MNEKQVLEQAANCEVRVIGGATLIRGDALRVLPHLSQVDALITDPPYSSGGMVRSDRMQSPLQKYVQGGSSEAAAHNVNFSGDNRDQRSWTFWCTAWLSLARQLLRPGGYSMVFTDWRQLPALTDAFQSGGLVWRGLVPWDKTNSSRAPHKGYFRHQCEYVVWGSNGPLPVAEHGGPWPGLVSQRVDHREKLHMTGKPVEMMGQFVQAAPPGGVVLDPFMGSASTGVAAIRSGRRFIGIEQDAHYLDVACRRLERELCNV
ncbi:DNA-methyltransferase [Comamonas terrigena]|uniref:DNA-methyltransferase n=1 Tax=Comamonas terrigena TaxID=32013 RepID=UPI00235695ED|nr:DNA methyltransferase [Comamonas terrigena]